MADRAVIQLVQVGSPAEQAGLQVNDEVVSVSGVFIDDTQNTFSALISQYSGGEQVELGVIRFGESDMTRIDVTLATLLPPLIITPSAEITVSDQTELVVDIGFNGVTGILVLTDSAQVREPVTGSQVNVPAGSAVIVAPGYQIGNPITVNDGQITSWWEGERPSIPVAPTAAPVITPVINNSWILGLGALGICGAGFFAIGLFVIFSRRRSAETGQQTRRPRFARQENLGMTKPSPPETLDAKKSSKKPPPPERLK